VFLKASKEEIDKKELAYLIDRSRILKKLPQVYGTQYKQLPNNQIDFFQIEKAEDVDIRRAEFGMETLGEYKKRAESFLKT
jgi:mannose-1-phosphate guanylyltransferase